MAWLAKGSVSGVAVGVGVVFLLGMCFAPAKDSALGPALKMLAGLSLLLVVSFFCAAALAQHNGVWTAQGVGDGVPSAARMTACT